MAETSLLVFPETEAAVWAFFLAVDSYLPSLCVHTYMADSEPPFMPSPVGALASC